VGLSRDTFRHPPETNPMTRRICRRKIIEMAQVRRRFGYRRLHDMLRPEFPNVNHKKVYRLYSEASLAVRRRKKAKRPSLERQPLAIATAPNGVWSMDFVSDALANARRLKCLTVADDFTHECVDITVDHGMGGAYVTRVRLREPVSATQLCHRQTRLGFAQKANDLFFRKSLLHVQSPILWDWTPESDATQIWGDVGEQRLCSNSQSLKLYSDEQKQPIGYFIAWAKAGYLHTPCIGVATESVQHWRVDRR
jgi:hypothetical protein